MPKHIDYSLIEFDMATKRQIKRLLCCSSESGPERRLLIIIGVKILIFYYPVGILEISYEIDDDALFLADKVAQAPT